jgi:hypothetical protein
MAHHALALLRREQIEQVWLLKISARIVGGFVRLRIGCLHGDAL